MANILYEGRNYWEDRTMMTYKVTDEGVLYISGSLSGKFPVHIDPAYKFSQVVIEEGVTSVGSKCFYQMQNIQELTLPSTVTNIGD